MFDLDISKMIIVGVVALAVIPPKDLPRVMRTVGQTVGKMRRMAAEFQGQFMDAMREVEREADLDSVKKEFQAISEQAKIDTSFDPVGMVRDDVNKAAAPPIEFGAALPSAVDSAKPEAGSIAESPASLTEPVSAEAPLVAEAPAAAPEPVSEPPDARRSAAE
jgi:sec-independent protein translocase protein TatB